MKPLPPAKDPSPPQCCAKCGGRYFEDDEDGWKCCMCGWIKYVVSLPLDKVKSYRLNGG